MLDFVDAVAENMEVMSEMLNSVYALLDHTLLNRLKKHIDFIFYGLSVTDKNGLSQPFHITCHGI